MFSYLSIKQLYQWFIVNESYIQVLNMKKIRENQLKCYITEKKLKLIMPKIRSFQNETLVLHVTWADLFNNSACKQFKPSFTVRSIRKKKKKNIYQVLNSFFN